MTSKSKKLSRRRFLSQSSKAVAGIAATGILASCNNAPITAAPKSRIRGANDRIITAVLGVRGPRHPNTKPHDLATINYQLSTSIPAG